LLQYIKALQNWVDFLMQTLYVQWTKPEIFMDLKILSAIKGIESRKDDALKHDSKKSKYKVGTDGFKNNESFK